MNKLLAAGAGESADAAHFALLLERVGQHRDREAFAELFAHYGPRLKSYLRRLGSDDGPAEELVQEVMILVWRKAHQFDRGRAAAATWIFTIARNKRVDSLRRARQLVLDADDPLIETIEDASAARTIELAQEGVRLREAIKALPHDQAEVIRKSFLEDKTHRMISDELNIPLGTVKSRLRLAFQRLRTLLGEPE